MNKQPWCLQAILILGMVSLVGCGDASSSYKKEFVLGCTRGGVPAAICNCTFDVLNKKYGVEGWQRIQTQGPSEQTWIDMAGATRQCSEKYAAR